ncbi:MAG: hypothetical protein IPG67_08030 [Acidobacteria bacterium]|nr:hypothetical protein [Acidobacteriota bacterium]
MGLATGSACSGDLGGSGSGVGRVRRLVKQVLGRDIFAAATRRGAVYGDGKADVLFSGPSVPGPSVVRRSSNAAVVALQSSRYKAADFR